MTKPIVTVERPDGFSGVPYGSFSGKPQPVPSAELVTGTNVIQLPINCVLAGNQPLELSRTEIEWNDADIKTRILVKSSGVSRLSENKPSFTVTTTKRGYD